MSKEPKKEKAPPAETGKKLTLFKSGKEWRGNRNGRPKGSRSLSSLLKEALKGYAQGKNGKALLIDPETNKPITWENALIKRVIEKAIVRGDYKSIELIFDRIEGKPRQKIDFNDETEGREERFNEIKKLISILTHGQDTTQKEDSGEEDL